MCSWNLKDVARNSLLLSLNHTNCTHLIVWTIMLWCLNHLLNSILFPSHYSVLRLTVPNRRPQLYATRFTYCQSQWITIHCRELHFIVPNFVSHNYWGCPLHACLIIISIGCCVLSSPIHDQASCIIGLTYASSPV